MKIYTKSGDTGESSLFGGSRVRKDNPRLAAYGTLDELNALLGLARAEVHREALLDPAWRQSADTLLHELQNRLFDLGAELAARDASLLGDTLLGLDQVEQLETAIDHQEASLPKLKEFILPGGTPVAAQLHVARCVCRRAERLMVALDEAQPLRPVTLQYINRLSDFLFVLARGANQACQKSDICWKKSGQKD